MTVVRGHDGLLLEDLTAAEQLTRETRCSEYSRGVVRLRPIREVNAAHVHADRQWAGAASISPRTEKSLSADDHALFHLSNKPVLPSSEVSLLHFLPGQARRSWVSTAFFWKYSRPFRQGE